jgi:hypothetical protein
MKAPQSETDRNSTAFLPSRREWLGVLLLVGGLLVFDLATYNFYPAVWCDEMMYSEPAVNWVQHGSFTSATHQYQPPNTFPIAGCPLYSLTLVPWLSVTGTSLLAARSLNYALMALATFLCWNVTWRFGLVRSPFARLLLLTVLHLGYGISFSYRCCRPDTLGMVCLLLLVLAFKIQHRGLRELSLAALGAVAVLIGLQVALFACFACSLAWLMLRRPAFRDLVLLALGTVVGTGALVWFLYSKGVLLYFLPFVASVMNGTLSSPSPARAGSFKVAELLSFAVDFSLVALIPLLVLLVTAARKRLPSPTRKLVFGALVLIFGLPLLFRVVGHYRFYYSYLLYVPASLALFAAYSDLAAGASGVGRWLKVAFALTVAGAILAGLPLRLGLTMAFSKLATRAEIQRILASQISSKDVAFSEYLTYFEVKQLVPLVYHFFSSPVLCPTGLPGFDLTAENKRAVSVLVIRPEHRDLLCAYFGGDWKALTAPFGDTQDWSALTSLPIVGSRFARHASQMQVERHQVQVFRRVPDSAGPGPAARSKAAD